MPYNETLRKETAMPFLKNREVRIKLSKTNKNENDPSTAEELLTPETIALIENAGKRIVKHLAITVVAVIGVVTAMETIKEIAVKKTKSADKE